MEEIKNVELNEQDVEQVAGGRYPYKTTIINYNGQRCKLYIVESGDTLTRICNNLCKPGSMDAVCIFNGISNPDRIYARQKIYIPQRLWK